MSAVLGAMSTIKEYRKKSLQKGFYRTASVELENVTVIIMSTGSYLEGVKAVTIYTCKDLGHFQYAKCLL